MGKDVRITENTSSESGVGAVLDSFLRISTLGTVGLPESGTTYDVEVDGKHVGTYSSKDEAYKAASKK